jgi:hypothetical protein
MAKVKTIEHGSTTLTVREGEGAKILATGRLARQKQSVGRLLAVPTELDEEIGALVCGGPNNARFIALLMLGLSRLKETNAQLDLQFGAAHD